MLTIINKETPDIVLISETKLNKKHKVHVNDWLCIVLINKESRYKLVTISLLYLK